MLLTEQMPDLRQYKKSEEKVQALYEYMYRLQNELNHVLSNLDENNLSKDLKGRLCWKPEE